MTLAREINEKLDEMLSVQSQIKELTELESDAKFSNTETGEVVTKEIVVNKGEQRFAEIKEELNQITNNGTRGRNVFSNPYYINDRLLDKTIAKEIKANEVKSCLSNQNNPNNN